MKPVWPCLQSIDLAPHSDWPFRTGLRHENVPTDLRVWAAANNTDRGDGGCKLAALVKALLVLACSSPRESNRD